MSEVERAWLACAIDGEGCVGFYEGGITKNGKRKWPRAEVRVANTDRRFCEHAKQVSGLGYISTMNVNRTRFGKKPVYQWSIHGHITVKWLLEQVLPYLVIKKEKSLTVLDKINARKWGRWGEDKRIKHSVIMTQWWENRR